MIAYTMTEKTIKARECRHVVHIPTKSPDVPDLHIVKEILHFEDGTTRPQLRKITNYKRPFWVTSPQYRNHEQKKEYEDLDKLRRYECTQSDLRMRVARALDMAYSNTQLKQLASSPYLYGTDISSTALIKREYMDKWADLFTPYSIAFFDIETDMVNGTNDPIIVNVLFGKKLKSYAILDLFKGYSRNVIQSLYQNAVKKYIQKYVDRNELEVELILCGDTIELIRKSFAFIHECMPDFLAIWNMDFDVPRIMDTLKKYNVDPKDVFSDPRIPPEFRFCRYKKGSTKKITASGQVKPKNPSEQWHSVLCPSSFYIIDAMCTYRFLRQGDQEMPDYKLDTILDANLKERKLTFEEADAYKEGEWHTFMQKNYPFEYLVYANFDVIGMLELENKTKDLQQAFPVRSAHSDFSNFAFQTKRFADKYHHFLLKRGKVVATVPPRENPDIDDQALESEYDDAEDEDTLLDENGQEVILKSEVLSLKSWIVTLKAHLSVLGQQLIEENEWLSTMIRAFVYDSDAVSAYPSCTMAGNVSLETTFRELIEIIDIEEDVFRAQHINLLQGHVNALEFAEVMYRLPPPQEALKYFDDL